MNVRRRKQLSISYICKKYIQERQEFKNQLREIGIVEYNVKNIVTCGIMTTDGDVCLVFKEDWTGRTNLINLIKI